MADPLATLSRLRKLEADRARRDLAAALTAEHQAEAEEAAAAAALRREAAAHPADVSHALARAFANWRPAGTAALHAAAAARVAAVSEVAISRNDLAACRAAERAVEVLQSNCADARADALKRWRQAELDDFRVPSGKSANDSISR